MRVPRGSVLLLGLAAFSCSGSGAPGNDLFNDGGTSATAGTSAAHGGSASTGGSFGYQGGSGQGGSGQGGAAAGASSAAGGATHAAGGTPTGGTSSANGGSLSAGGTTATSGGTSSGGASMTGGVSAASGGTANGGSSAGGAIANGGVASGGTTASGGASGGQGSGGGKGMSCEMLRTQLSSYLDSAQACQRNQASQNTCSETVMNECGCQVPVNASNTTAITSYNSTLAQLEKQCPNVACAAVRCANPSNASCSGNGPGAGQCTASPYQGGPGP